VGDASYFKIFVPYIYFRRLIRFEDIVFAVTFVEIVSKVDGYLSNYSHLTSKVGRKVLCPARFLCHGNGSQDEILSICLAQENRKMHPSTHSGKLSKNEMPGSVR
jgi:hypothetical protein